MTGGTSGQTQGRWASVPGRTSMVAWGLALGFVVAPAPASAQVDPSRPAPSLDASRPAPGLDRQGSGDAPGFDQRPAPAATNPNVDSSMRYRFIESYGDPKAPGNDIGPYRVAFVEVLNQAMESPGAAPQRTQLGSRVVYVGRPAAVAGLENRQVPAMVRHYESVQVNRDGQPDARPDGPTGLAGQTLWVEDRGGPAPTILTLPGSPPLTQEQFGFAAYQQVYVPELSGVLSALHVGVGSAWTISEEAAEALVGDRVREGTLEAQFEDVIPPGEGETRSRALIRVSGRLQLVNSTAAVNALVEFAFDDPSRGAPDDPSRPVGSLTPKLIDAKGAVVRLLLAQRDVIEIPDDSGRIVGRATQLRELNLERRFDLQGVSVPSLPSPTPTPTPDNSWVVYQDPESRFRFRHPQEFRPSPIEPMDGETINLERPLVAGVPDYLTFVFFPRGTEALEIRPEPFTRRIKEVWQSVPAPGVNLGRGSEGYLPEQEWPNKRVYRVELPISYRASAYALDDQEQAYFAAYLVQFANGAVAELEAITESNPEAFRAEVEAILKTFEIDPPRPRAAAAPSAPARPSPSTTPTPGNLGATAPPADAAAPPAPTAPAPAPEPEIDLPPVRDEPELPPISTDDPPAPDPGLGADRPSRPPPPPFE